MKNILIYVIIFSLFSLNVFAAMSPAPAYCEHQGYSYEFNGEEREMWCIFDDDNNRCDAVEFLNGGCGAEYIKEIPCREEGEFVFSQFEECCNGLEPYLPKEVLGQPKCERINIFQKFWRWLGSIF